MTITEGSNTNVRDYYDSNSNASTECSGNSYLAGDGSCQTVGDQNIQLGSTISYSVSKGSTQKCGSGDIMVGVSVSGSYGFNQIHCKPISLSN